ncbi:hypothetical protein FQZ97_1064970 [compost metagenome]
MPSSPPVMGERSAMKYTSCALASVIIENAMPARRIASRPVTTPRPAATSTPNDTPSAGSKPHTLTACAVP